MGRRERGDGEKRRGGWGEEEMGRKQAV